MVRTGRGYVPAERNKEEGLPIGVIPVDSMFSPVTRANFHVENARVGRMTDYDKLTLEVWTDGSVTPRDAISSAAVILREHLEIFVRPEELGERKAESWKEEERGEINKHLFRSVNELDVEDEEFRQEIAERDQRDPRRNGTEPRDENRSTPVRGWQRQARRVRGEAPCVTEKKGGSWGETRLTGELCIGRWSRRFLNTSGSKRRRRRRRRSEASQNG